MSGWAIFFSVSATVYGYTWLLENQPIWVPKVLSAMTKVRTWWNDRVKRSRFQNVSYVVYEGNRHGTVFPDTVHSFITNQVIPISWAFDPCESKLYVVPVSTNPEEQSHHHLPYLAGTIRKIDTLTNTTYTADMSEFLSTVRVVCPNNASCPSVPPSLLFECYEFSTDGYVPLYSKAVDLILDVITDEGEEQTFNVKTNELLVPDVEIPDSSESSGPESTESASGEAQTETPPSEREPSDQSADEVSTGEPSTGESA